MGLAPSTTTIFFSFYVVGVVGALVGGGGLADQIGRKPVILASIILSIMSSAVLATQGPLWLLYAGRVLSGLSVGLCTGAFTAALTETIGARAGAITSTAITSCALAAGPMFSTMMISFVASPLRTPYVIYGVIGLVVLGMTILIVKETGTPTRGARWQIRVGVPRGMWLVFLPFALSIACAYGANGLFQSVVPLSMPSIGVHSQELMAAATAIMLACSAIVQVAAASWRGRGPLTSGLAILALGLVGTAGSFIVGSSLVFWVSTVAAGIGQGLAFRSSLYLLTASAPRGRIAQTVSSYYIVGYIATAVPSLGAGLAGGGAGVVSVVCALVAGVAALNIAVVYRTVRA